MIGKHIRELRRSKGYTSSDLAEVLNVTRQQAENYEKNVSMLDVPDFFAVCKWLDINPHYFYSRYFATLKQKRKDERK